MNAPRLISAGQQIVSLTLAALITSAVLLSLATQADARHADALAQSTQAARLCAAFAQAAVRGGNRQQVEGGSESLK